MNKKGFTMVELLATIVVMSILALLAVFAYTKYLDHARKEAYDTMAQSAANAASSYAMDHLGVNSVTFKTLAEDEYLEPPIDPASDSKVCNGVVEILEEDLEHTTTNVGANAIKAYEYDVTVCCANYSYVYHFPGGKKVKNEEACKTE